MFVHTFSCAIRFAVIFSITSGVARAADDPKAVDAVTRLGGKLERNDAGDITTVDLAGTKANDATLKLLAGLPNLETLDLQETLVTNSGVKGLAKLSALREVRLAGTKLSDITLRDLQKAAPQLQAHRNATVERLQKRLDALQGKGIKFELEAESAAAGTPAVVKLLRLNASYPCTDAQLQAVIEKVPEITSAFITNAGPRPPSNTPTPAALSLLRKLPKLEHVFVRMDLNEAAVAQLYGIESLRILTISCDHGVPDAFSPIDTRPRLSDALLMNAKGWSHLESLSIRENAVLGRNAAGVPNIGSALTDRSLAALERFPQLRKIELSQSQITDAGLRSFKRLGELTALDVTFCKTVTDASVATLSALKNLEYLHVSESSISAQGTAALKQALPNTKVTGN